MSTQYIAGTLVQVATYTGLITTPAGGFRDTTGTLADPGVVTLSVRDGTGLVTVTTYNSAGPYTITRDAAGLYSAKLDTTGKPGLWTYEWTGTGGVQAIAANSFNIQAAPV